jgi:chromosome segregation ATPase
MENSLTRRQTKDQHFRGHKNHQVNLSTSAQQLDIVSQLVAANTASNFFLQDQLRSSQEKSTELQHRANSLEAANYKLSTDLTIITAERDELLNIASSLTTANKLSEKQSIKRKKKIRELKRQIKNLKTTSDNNHR